MTNRTQAPDAHRWTRVVARAGGVETLLSYIVAGGVVVAVCRRPMEPVPT